MEEGKAIVYYGKGYGKTSAAIGNAIKTATGGGTVVMVQFLKGQLSSEMFKRLEPEIKIFRFEHNEECYDELDSQEQEEERQNFQTGLNYAKKVLTTGECDLLVMDEVLGLVAKGLVTCEDVLSVLNARDPFATVILTGTELPEPIRDAVDIVFDIKPEKGWPSEA